jgi:hypothetical protein
MNRKSRAANFVQNGSLKQRLLEQKASSLTPTRKIKKTKAAKKK